MTFSEKRQELAIQYLPPLLFEGGDAGNDHCCYYKGYH